MVTQSDIARKVGLDISSVNKILNRRQGPVFRKETIRNVFQVARELGFSLERLKHQHRRNHERKLLSIPVGVEVYRPDGTLLEAGEGILEDLSQGGGRIANVKLAHGLLPIGGAIGISPQSKNSFLKSPRRGQVVRFSSSNGSSGFSIRFAEHAPASE